MTTKRQQQLPGAEAPFISGPYSWGLKPHASSEKATAKAGPSTPLLANARATSLWMTLLWVGEIRTADSNCKSRSSACGEG